MGARLISPLAVAGLSFGNGQDIHGIRLTWRDGDFRRVNGINFSLWMPYSNPSGEVNGIAPSGPRTRRSAYARALLWDWRGCRQ